MVPGEHVVVMRWLVKSARVPSVLDLGKGVD